MEIWKDIPDYEKQYQVSNYGRVRTLDRIIKNGKKSTRLIKGQVLKIKKATNGYLLVHLNKEHKAKTVRVHRLVAMAFIPTSSFDLDVNHLDGDKHNNHFKNLEWVTRSENIKHAHKIGLNKSHKLTVCQVLFIRWSKIPQRKQAKMFGVDKKTIQNVQTKTHYQWIP